MQWHNAKDNPLTALGNLWTAPKIEAKTDQPLESFHPWPLVESLPPVWWNIATGGARCSSCNFGPGLQWWKREEAHPLCRCWNKITFWLHSTKDRERLDTGYLKSRIHIYWSRDLIQDTKRASKEDRMQRTEKSLCQRTKKLTKRQNLF